jgi:hypothetical protein
LSALRRGRPDPRRRRRRLARFAAEFQARRVVPRCGACRRPCCRLETLVLELDWERLAGLWSPGVPKSVFDAALARGEGPPEIRSAGGLYYAYRRVCPAFDEAAKLCRVYAGGLKPSGCTDFPVYEEEGALVADLRCEAVDLRALEEELARELGPGATFSRTEDRDFPFLVRYRSARRGRRLARRV